ncbi:transglycosylase domain-containing protein [Gaopeijia maritima]|uniref:peptidoglycan glycosyltransferase n=1 Tax=Gaopeijia maritima TaxID=3119007 RepID=A0ABU9E6X1_9BACT
MPRSPDASPAEAPSPPESAPSRWRWLRIALLVVGGALLIGVPLVIWEASTSTLQARWFSARGRDLDWTVRAGPSARIRFPSEGPWDVRLGYVALPAMIERARDQGFSVTAQAVVTEAFQQRVDAGWYPVYPEKSRGGLVVRDRRSRLLHTSPNPARVYESFPAIPREVWGSLLYIENRNFLDSEAPRLNPAVDWPRLTRAVGELGLSVLGSERNVPGGSTLATQLEKFRHSPGGLTGSVLDKARQMEAAAMRAYIDGPETLRDRQETVRDYLNSVPLAAQRGHGEVVGLADGLRAWFGTPFDSANALLLNPPADDEGAEARAKVFRQVLSLLVAHRRPSFYLAQERGNEELGQLTDAYLRLMARDSVIDGSLARQALGAEVEILRRAPEPDPVPFVERKASTAVRTALLPLLGSSGLYELDRLDLSVRTTLDMTWQTGVAQLFDQLHDPAFVASGPFGAFRLLGTNDPTRVLYSFTLLERTDMGLAVRVQNDNFDGPFNLTSAGRLELGSTAKLRTLVSYLQVVAALHDRLAPMAATSIDSVRVADDDPLTAWAVQRMRARPGTTKRQLLDEAMLRTYSANPAQRFLTGGGVQTFSNFDATHNNRRMTVQEAFDQSVNLPFVRMMRELVQYFMYLEPGSTAYVLEAVDDPARQAYLERFADQEGRAFTRDFYRRYDGVAPDSILHRMVEDRALGPTRTAWAFRAVQPDAAPEAFEAFLRATTPLAGLTPGVVEDLFTQTDPAPHDINDLGYLARIHPLELWVVQRLLEDPATELQTLLDEGAAVRREVYEWLFRTSRRNAQDTRIRSILELESFRLIHRQWQRLGYPFADIVPSLGTSIGSSGDRPMALAELLGILINRGVRQPVVRVEELLFADGTPFETRMRRNEVRGEQVLDPVVAEVALLAMQGVVQRGTARRAAGSVTDADGTPVVMGAKTGTGDNRYRVYAPGGALVESRAVNRTATLVFTLADRYVGVVTAYVPGPDADAYAFTSALPSEIFRAIGPVLSPLPGVSRVDAATAPNSISAAPGGAPPVP